MFKFVSIALFLFLIVSSCSQIKRNEGSEAILNYSALITLNLPGEYDDIPQNSSLSKLLDTLIVIPLETNPECIITTVRKIRFSEDRIFILDGRQEVIFIFSRDGKYINKIDRKGKGPKEYFQLTDFTINDNGEIVIISFGRKLLAYRFDGRFSWSRKISIMAATDIEYISDRIYFISALYRDSKAIGKSLQYNLFRFHEEKGILEKYFSYDDYFGKNHQFTKNEYFGTGVENVSYFTRFYDNTVYKLLQDSVIAYKAVKIQDLILEKEKVFNIVDLSAEFTKEKIFAYLCNYHETSTYDYLSYRISNSKVNLYMNKETGETYFTTNPQWLTEANFYTYILGFHSPYCTQAEYFVTAFYPKDWLDSKRLMDSYSKNEMNSNVGFSGKYVHESLQKLDELSNPVLVKYSLK